MVDRMVIVGIRPVHEAIELKHEIRKNSSNQKAKCRQKNRLLLAPKKKVLGLIQNKEEIARSNPTKVVKARDSRQQSLIKRVAAICSRVDEHWLTTPGQAVPLDLLSQLRSKQLRKV